MTWRVGFEAGLNRIKTDDITLNSGKFDLIRLFGLPPSYAIRPESQAEATTTMKLTTIAGGLLAVLVITGSAAALPGAAGAQADDHADNAQADNAAEQAANDTEQAANETAGADENESSGAAEAADRRGPPADAGQAGDQRGPPSDLPEQVPDFVSEIHTLIGQKQAGELTGDLGAQISDLTPGDESDAAENETESPSESGDADDAAAESTEDADADDERSTEDAESDEDQSTDETDSDEEQSTDETDSDEEQSTDDDSDA